MSWQSWLFIPLAATSFGYAGYRFWILYRLMLAQQGKGPVLDRVWERIRMATVYVMGQRAVFHQPAPGLMHACIFWGFLVISVGTLEQFASTIHGAADFEFIGYYPYLLYAFLQDVSAFVVVAALVYAAYRRYIVRPEGLGTSPDALIIIGMITALMVAIIFMNAFRFLAEPKWFDTAMPMTGWIASGLSGLNLSQGATAELGIVFKWIHILIVLGFAVYIPGSKHLHIVAAAPNTFLRKIEREKGMTPIPFHDESLTQYGAAKVTDLSWKDALDFYSCTECGRCQDLCPAYITQKPLSPKKLIVDLKRNLLRNKEKILARKGAEVDLIIDDKISEDMIWACMSCRACEIVCPVFIEHTDKIFNIRRDLVMMQSRFPPEVKLVFRNMEANATPWSFSSADRTKWAEGLNIRTMAEDSNVDYLLWVGCAGAFDDRNKKVVRSFVNLLNRAGVKVGILGNEERCTGDAARRIGNEYLFQSLAKANVEILNRYQVRRIITTCPHCYNTLKNEYRAFGGIYEVTHHSEFLAKLLSVGNIKPTKSLDTRITFHDSCYLGRWNGIYTAPRDVLRAISEVEPLEMKQNQDESMCCGAGGGRMWMEEKIGKRVCVARAEQAIETNADLVATACPFCITMMMDGLKFIDAVGRVRVLDIAEILDYATS